VGGLNEKIEGFFAICQTRGLDGNQGVIIPVANVRHLCLRQELLDAVKAGQFSIWAIEDVMDALPY
jgi:Lon-like ATP-dependent protease